MFDWILNTPLLVQTAVHSMDPLQYYDRETQRAFRQNAKNSTAEIFEIEDERTSVSSLKMKSVEFSGQRQVNEHSCNFLHGKTNLPGQLIP